MRLFPPVIYSTPLLCFYYGGISHLTFNPLCERSSPELYNPVIIVVRWFHCSAVSHARFYPRFTQERQMSWQEKRGCFERKTKHLSLLQDGLTSTSRTWKFLKKDVPVSCFEHTCI